MNLVPPLKALGSTNMNGVSNGQQQNSTRESSIPRQMQNVNILSAQLDEAMHAGGADNLCMSSFYSFSS